MNQGHRHDTPGQSGEAAAALPRGANKTGGLGRRSGVTRDALVGIVAALQGRTIIIVLVVRGVAGVRGAAQAGLRTVLLVEQLVLVLDRGQASFDFLEL